jgi:hypothetical protein
LAGEKPCRRGLYSEGKGSEEVIRKSTVIYSQSGSDYDAKQHTMMTNGS